MARSHDYDLISIGSGPAGQRAAVQAAKLGKRAAIVERRTLGGVSLDTGTIPSKTLREAVLFFASLGSRFDRRSAVRADQTATAEALLLRIGDVLDREMRVVEDQLRRNDVELLHGEASFEDPHTLVVRGKKDRTRVTSDKIVIAVGTRPAMPPGVDPDGEIVLTSDDIIRLKKLPRRMAVVGAGVIGMEYASMFATIGVEVTVVEKRERPLEFLDREILDELVHQMRNREVVFRFGEAVASIEVAREDGGGRAVLLLESGKRIVSDVVLFSAGRIAATESLALEAAGIVADDRGRLKVDESFRTSVPHIFAAGDVVGFPSLAATSSEQGRLAACTAFGVPHGGMSPHFPIGIYAVPEISTVGATEEELTKGKVPYETGVARYREIARGQILGDESGLFKMLFHRETRALLGVHCVGTGATELVHIGQAVLRLGGGLDYFLQTVFNYPTLAECYKVAALDASNKLSA